MNIEIEILTASYWEHFKFAKDLALILPLDHHKRKRIENEINIISDKLQKLKSEEI